MEKATLMVSLVDLIVIVTTTIKILNRIGSMDKQIALIEYRTARLENE